MKIRILIIVLLFLTLISTECSAVIVKWYNIPKLVSNSSVIAKGTISIVNTETVLTVERILKGDNYYKLIIKSQTIGEIPIAVFHNGEEVLLFLETPDADGIAYLVGYGDQSKWPRDKENGGYGNILLNASLKDIQHVVEKLLQAERTNRLRDRIRLCEKYIKSSSVLLQLVTIQYILDDLFWSRIYPSSTSSLVTEKRIRILKRFSNYAVTLSNSVEPEIREGAIRLLRNAPKNISIPIFIEKITDENYGVRNAVEVALRELTVKLKMGDEFGFDPRDPPEKLKFVKEKWRKWWVDKEKKFDNKK